LELQATGRRGHREIDAGKKRDRISWNRKKKGKLKSLTLATGTDLVQGKKVYRKNVMVSW